MNDIKMVDILTTHIKNIETISFIKHTDNDWILTPIGEGGFGLVYKGENKNSDNNNLPKIVCVKKIPNEKFLNVEVKVLLKLNEDERSIKYYGCGEDNDHKYIYTEYILDESISGLINYKIENKLWFSDDEIIEMATGMASTLVFVHQNNIIHRDIKSEHIFIIRDEQRNIKCVKYIDFGLSRLFSDKEGSKNYSVLGTDRYMAPEVKVNTGKACRKSDVYSLGCVLLEMAGAEVGLPGDHKGTLLKNYDDDGVPVIPGHVSARLRNIIQRCTLKNIHARFDSECLYNHLLKIKNLKTDEADKTKPKGDEYLELNSQGLSLSSIPSSVTYLSLPSFNQDIVYDSIPPTVKYLDLGDEFDIQNNGDNLPDESILMLKCGFKFTKILNKRTIPSSVTDLQLHNYNIPLLGNSIPKTVISLTLGSNFNDIHAIESLIHLPSSIVNLNIGTDESNVPNIIRLINKSISSIMINGEERRYSQELVK